MAQFDVYKNTNEGSNERVPYVLDIQHDLLDNLSTRVVIPLVRDIKPLSHLNPIVEVSGMKVVLSTAEMASIPVAVLGEKVVSLAEFRQDIVGSVDFMITGF
ncbi:MAG: CcdB family protein [Campylobacterota bacterium]